MYRIYKFLLLTISFINLIKIKLKKIYLVNYFILINNNGILDKRSLYYFDQQSLRFSLNLIRFSKLNLRIFLRILTIPNFFCFSLLREVFDKEKKFFNIIIKIFTFLKIKKFLFIDDYREMSLFSKVSKKLKIETLVYMHGKFTKNSKILRKTYFSRYLVWSKFFNDQLLKANKRYNKKNVEIVGCPYLESNKNLKKRIKNIKIKKCLILDEDYVSFREVKKYLEILVKTKNIKFFLKRKITRDLPDSYLNYCKKHKIKLIDENLSLGSTIKKLKIDCLIAATSTGLIESSYYDVIAVKIKSNNKNREKEFSEFLRLNLVHNVNDPSKITKYLTKNYKLKNINKIKDKLWGNHIFSENKVKNDILNFIKN